MDFMIPNFEINDLIFLFFIYENKEKYLCRPAFDSIVFLNNVNLYVS